MRISGVTYVSRKTHTVRNAVAAVVILLLLLCITLVILSAYNAWSLIHPHKVEIPALQANDPTSRKDIGFKDARGSLTLKGWLFSAEDSDKAVILVHDNGSNRMQFGLQTLDMIQGFLSKGYSVLTFDLRGSGLSGGSTTTYGADEREDVLGAVRFITSRGYDNVILAGFGTGASACILAASAGGTGTASVKAVIADSPYSDLEEHFKRKIPEWTGLPAFPFDNTIQFAIKTLSGLDAADVSPKKAIASVVPLPLLLIQGTDDTDTPVSCGRSLYTAYEKAGGNALKLWEVPEAGHLEAYKKDKQSYLQTIFDFLSRYVYIS